MLCGRSPWNYILQCAYANLKPRVHPPPAPLLTMGLSNRIWSLKGTQKMLIKKIKNTWSSHYGAAETNLTSNHEVVCSIPGLAQRVKDPALP